MADKGEITLLENDVMEDMLEDYYQKGDEQFIKLIDAYGTGRNDANIEEIIKRYMLWQEVIHGRMSGMNRCLIHIPA